MANYHSDEWIMKQVQEHYEEALSYFPEDRIVGIFYQGSGNYGLDYENSDVDTKLIVIPTWDDICFNKKAISTTHVRANDEHIDFKDIRLMFQTFRKQNLNFIEILFTKYKILNPIYAQAWNHLLNFNEAVAHYNPVAAVKTMKGIAMEKYHALEHPYPSKVDVLAEWGYDPKQLHHLLRVEEYIKRYINGESYADCLISKQAWYLKEVKNGLYDLQDARKLATASLQITVDLADKFAETGRAQPTPFVDELLDSVQDTIMRKAIRLELEKG